MHKPQTGGVPASLLHLDPDPSQLSRRTLSTPICRLCSNPFPLNRQSVGDISLALSLLLTLPLISTLPLPTPYLQIYEAFLRRRGVRRVQVDRAD